MSFDKRQKRQHVAKILTRQLGEASKSQGIVTGQLGQRFSEYRQRKHRRYTGSNNRRERVGVEPKTLTGNEQGKLNGFDASAAASAGRQE